MVSLRLSSCEPLGALDDCFSSDCLFSDSIHSKSSPRKSSSNKSSLSPFSSFTPCSSFSSSWRAPIMMSSFDDFGFWSSSIREGNWFSSGGMMWVTSLSVCKVMFLPASQR
ncbi:unnamed protein product [Microthlaspi erraticum]|uniref:Uncharacterized protein n=1 Tax=Microthlaspi erraticum TaxID=1685480 RepID=A0A6D2HQI0_9BRAS|nr:unnamed protein product [Microthlaspi erraticum]